MDDATSHRIEERIIPLSRKKIVLIILGSLAFVGLGIWMWGHASGTSMAEGILLRVISVLSIGFFGLCGIYGCVKIFDSKPGLIIDQEGIIDSSSAAAVGRVPWSEITGVTISEISGQKFLTIHVTDPEKYMERGGAMTKRMHRMNLKMTGSPINLSSNALGIDFNELCQILSVSLDAAQKTKPFDII